MVEQIVSLVSNLVEFERIMEAVKKAKSRLKLFPQLLTQCSKEGLIYAQCVTQTDDPKLNQCEKEFQVFKSCLNAAAKKKSIRI